MQKLRTKAKNAEKSPENVRKNTNKGLKNRKIRRIDQIKKTKLREKNR